MKKIMKKRVLQLNSGSSNFGGVSSFLYNVYTHIDREKVQFDFISPNKTAYGIYREEIESMGGRIYELGISGNILTRKIKLYTKLKKFLLENEYSVIHINSGNFFFNLFAVKAAKSAGVKNRIVHSHNAGDTSQSGIKRVLFQLLKPVLEESATELYACSQKAAEYMYTDFSCKSGKVSLIKNGIELERFDYSCITRSEIRKKLKLNGKIVVGHVGRFLEQKNHEFLIKVFKEIHEMNDNAVLLLFGTGEKQGAIEQMVKALEIEEFVSFMGVVKNIEDMYQAMDVFVMPSYHEGLPVACIEAQVAGVPCVLADTITEEVKICDSVKFLSLNSSPKEWGSVALSMASFERQSAKPCAEAKGYSIYSVANMLQRHYSELFEMSVVE